MESVNEDRRHVYIVDDDLHMRNSLSRLLHVAGYRCRVFESAVAYLEAGLDPHDAACLVLDIRMPELTGIELQGRLRGTGHDVPIVFVSAFGDIPTCVRTLKAGAVSFLQKPFEPSVLLNAVDEAIRISCNRKKALARRHAIQRRFSLLSPRERDVFWKVVKGLLNKQIAAELGIAEKTVKVHRARVMSKMEVISVADLVRLSEACDDPERRAS